jgi:hypothetical protein
MIAIHVQQMAMADNVAVPGKQSTQLEEDQ